MNGRISSLGLLLLAVLCWTLYLLACSADDWLIALLAEQDGFDALPDDLQRVFEEVSSHLGNALEGWHSMARHAVFDDPRYGLLLDKLKATGLLFILRLLNHRYETALFLSFLGAVLLDALYVRRIRNLAFKDVRPAMSYLAGKAVLLTATGIMLALATPHADAFRYAEGLGAGLLTAAHIAFARNRKRLG